MKILGKSWANRKFIVKGGSRPTDPTFRSAPREFPESRLEGCLVVVVNVRHLGKAATVATVEVNNPLGATLTVTATVTDDATSLNLVSLH